MRDGGRMGKKKEGKKEITGKKKRQWFFSSDVHIYYV